MKKFIFASAMALALLSACGKEDEPLVYETNQDEEPAKKPYELPEFYNKYVPAPAGFDKEGKVAHGKYVDLSYNSTVAGTIKKGYVYLPPNYNASKKYVPGAIPASRNRRYSRRMEIRRCSRGDYGQPDSPGIVRAYDYRIAKRTRDEGSIAGRQLYGRRQGGRIPQF